MMARLTAINLSTRDPGTTTPKRFGTILARAVGRFEPLALWWSLFNDGAAELAQTARAQRQLPMIRWEAVRAALAAPALGTISTCSMYHA